MSFSENLKSVREKKNLSQEQLAELLGVSGEVVSKWEQDAGYPETEIVIQIAKKLDVSLDCLLLDKPTKEETQELLEKRQAAYSPDRKISVQAYDGTVFTGDKFEVIKSKFPHKDGPVCHIVGSNSSLLGTLSAMFVGDYVILGWYSTIEDAKQEMNGLTLALQNGEASYQVKYYAEYEVSGIFRRKKIK